MSGRGHRLLNRKWLFLLSLFLIVRAVALAIGVVFFALGAYEQNITHLIIAGACLALILLLQMIHSIEHPKIICPNCRSQILRSNRCAKHRMAKKLLGSYSLRLAFQIVFTNAFLCQFCNQRYQWRGKKPGRPAHPDGT